MSESGYTWRSRGEKTIPLPLWDGNGDDRTIDLLLPRAIDPEHPPMTVVVLAGGGYGRRTWHEGPGTALWLAMHGFAAASVPYTTAEDTPGDRPVGPLALLDACRAIRVVRDHAAMHGLSPERVGVLGYSAGGHLAGSTALLHGETDQDDPLSGEWSGRPDAVMLIYPVVSMIPPCHNGSWHNLLGRDASMTERERRSLQTRVTEKAPPLFMVYAQDDPAVPVRGAIELIGAYERAGVPFEAHFYPKGGHGFGLGLDGVGPKGETGVSTWPGLLSGWLRGL